MDWDNTSVGHLAWCALVALNLARKDGEVSSYAHENIFLIRWLATAEKRQLFRKELISDIRWLLKEGREKGIRADLPGKLEYLWHAGSGNLLLQNDLFRLQHLLQSLKNNGWIYMMLSEKEWAGRKAIQLNSVIPGIYLNQRAMASSFDEHGFAVKPLPARITGNHDGLDDLFKRCGWLKEKFVAKKQSSYYHLLPIANRT